MTYLKINELKNGYLYRIRARNAKFGIWVESTGLFIISREKFDYNYLFEEFHYDLDKHFGTAKPLQVIEKTAFEEKDLHPEKDKMKYSKEEEMLKYLNSFERGESA